MTLEDAYLRITHDKIRPLSRMPFAEAGLLEHMSREPRRDRAFECAIDALADPMRARHRANPSNGEDNAAYADK